jgi:lipopolysaccharide transport system permease protein
MNLVEFFPSLAIGLTLWTFLSSSILEGCASFTLAEGIVKQLPIPLFIHVERVIARNFIIFLHNAMIIPLVLLFSAVSWSWLMLLCVFGMCLLMINLLWSALFVAIVCTRYRDLPQIISNAVQIAFYVTPIMWTASQFSDYQLLVDLNPLYHLIEIVRAPLLGKSPSLENWLVSIVMALVGWALTVVFFSRYRGRIAYWL